MKRELLLIVITILLLVFVQSCVKQQPVEVDVPILEEAEVEVEKCVEDEKGASKGDSSAVNECIGTNKVRQYYCLKDEINSKLVQCPGTCSKGICVAEGSNSNTINDVQQENNIIVKNEAPEPVEEIQILDSVCYDINGQGTKYMTKGNVTYQIQTNEGEQAPTLYSDYCEDDKVLVEYYCDGKEPKTETYDCLQEGVSFACDDGKCVDLNSCTDSDGGQDYKTKGSTYTVSYEGAEKVMVDYCKIGTDTTLIETVCGVTTTGPAGYTVEYMCSGLGSSYICKDGRCLIDIPIFPGLVG
jgi:hypothetical protein